MEKKIAHLKMIQEVIQRLANSSLVIRGWAITLTAGLFALAAKDAERRFFLLACLLAGVHLVAAGRFLFGKRVRFPALFGSPSDARMQLPLTVRGENPRVKPSAIPCRECGPRPHRSSSRSIGAADTALTQSYQAPSVPPRATTKRDRDQR